MTGREKGVKINESMLVTKERAGMVERNHREVEIRQVGGKEDNKKGGRERLEKGLGETVVYSTKNMAADEPHPEISREKEMSKRVLNEDVVHREGPMEMCLETRKSGSWKHRARVHHLRERKEMRKKQKLQIMD